MCDGDLSGKQAGFTLVELVMVLILVGVLSVGTVSLFSGASTYSNFLAKDVLVSQALLAQQSALGDTSSGFSTSLVIAVTDDEWRFTVSKSDGSSSESSAAAVERKGSALSVDGLSLGAGSSRTIAWNSQAQVTSGPHSFEFSGTGVTGYRVCLSREGFAYQLGGGDTCR